MIVFGHNSFTLNSCKPSQLGLPDHLDAEFTIERRQRYAHIFWIPTFGIGKIWALRKKNSDNLFQPSPELASFLQSLPLQEKTPWYTFSLPLLIVAGFILFSIYIPIDSYLSKKRAEKYLTEKIQGLENAINNPLPSQYFELSYPEGKTYLKVLSHTPNDLTCLFRDVTTGNYSDDRILEAFAWDTTYQYFDTVNIKKSELLSAINRNDSYSFKGSDFKDLGKELVLQNAVTYSFPVFKKLETGYEEGRFVLLVQNIGAAGQIKNLSTTKSNVIFSQGLFPISVETRQQILLVGTYDGIEPSLSGKVSVLNAEGDSAKYSVRISGLRFYLEQDKR
ncbi:hypothetical protein SanaruYs_10640 [Chryseotalea sanaruensis]|uniref:Uncharacterized protein n=1 Tax=Chryseotalea sanaruensis TaxID=2482724 RepID=A0A401U7I8_9BACT|nr:hypothetical protein [Chryseotalea sanaruensis]GCC50845.1 hypothetical protein SanaruYs_10640 [Chryseotalea sanaruensis]